LPSFWAATGLAAIPPTVSKMVVACQLDPTTLQHGWKIALAEKAMRDQTWKNIEDSSAQIRRKMTAKYQIEF
jgi:hypothetical protein